MKDSRGSHRKSVGCGPLFVDEYPELRRTGLQGIHDIEEFRIGCQPLPQLCGGIYEGLVIISPYTEAYRRRYRWARLGLAVDHVLGSGYVCTQKPYFFHDDRYGPGAAFLDLCQIHHYLPTLPALVPPDPPERKPTLDITLTTSPLPRMGWMRSSNMRITLSVLALLVPVGRSMSM
jgi:hypothetical protein